MNRLFRLIPILFLAIGVAAGFGVMTSCNVAGGGGTGSLTMLMTDAPTDEWTEVTVHFLSASLHRHGGDSWESFWQADPANPDSGKVNLIDLSGINTILQSATIPGGTYDRLKLVMNTSTQPDSMKLVTADGSVIAPENITVVDPSGNGTIKVELDPNLVVEDGTNNIVGIDFDLAHPLSIVNLDGKVVISLKVRHKMLPRNLSAIQFARTLGDVTAAAANADGTASFTVKTLQGALVDFGANVGTIYTDVSSGTAVAGSFDGLKALFGSSTGVAALVASNMNSDGSLYARRVWYADDINKLPQFTPEGLVRRVGDNWLSIQGKKTEDANDGHHHCDWDAETVFVDGATLWSFQGVDMGVKGTDGLRHISRGYRVEVVYVDENASPKVAQSINVQYAHREGVVMDPTLDNFQLGWMWRSKTMVYSAVTGHEFGWWFYGMDSTRSADRQAFLDVVAAARASNLWVFAFAGLTWDAPNTRWVVEELVLSPLKLHDFTKITTAYDAGIGSMGVSTYDCWDETTPETMTVKLDPTGDMQTLVGSFTWTAATNLVTFTVPVLPAQWPALLVPTVDKVKIWVRPVKEADNSYSWHAYSVLVYRFIR